MNMSDLFSKVRTIGDKPLKAEVLPPANGEKK